MRKKNTHTHTLRSYIDRTKALTSISTRFCRETNTCARARVVVKKQHIASAKCNSKKKKRADLYSHISCCLYSPRLVALCHSIYENRRFRRVERKRVSKVARERERDRVIYLYICLFHLSAVRSCVCVRSRVGSI